MHTESHRCPLVLGGFLFQQPQQEDDCCHDRQEVFVQDDDIPQGLKILEQYGAFGAAPGAWTSRVAPKAWAA
eukprot:g26416.t1